MNPLASSPILLAMALSVALHTATPSAAHADGGGLLQRLAGKWVGSGAARKREESPPELIKCRISATLDAEKQQLEQSGRCATADRTSSIVGEIRHDPETGRYLGHWSTRADGRTTALEGERIGDELHLIARDEKAGSIGSIIITPQGDDGYLMRMSKVPDAEGKGGETAEIRFERR